MTSSGATPLYGSSSGRGRPTPAPTCCRAGAPGSGRSSADLVAVLLVELARARSSGAVVERLDLLHSRSMSASNCLGRHVVAGPPERADVLEADLLRALRSRARRTARTAGARRGRRRRASPSTRRAARRACGSSARSFDQCSTSLHDSLRLAVRRRTRPCRSVDAHLGSRSSRAPRPAPGSSGDGAAWNLSRISCRRVSGSSLSRIGSNLRASLTSFVIPTLCVSLAFAAAASCSLRDVGLVRPLGDATRRHRACAAPCRARRRTSSPPRRALRRPTPAVVTAGFGGGCCSAAGSFFLQAPAARTATMRR